MNEPMLVVQLLGFIGLAFGALSFQPKHRKNILRFQLVSNTFWVMHFSLLGAPTGAALNAAGGLRAYLFNRYGSRKRRPLWLAVGIIGLMIVLAALTWQGWLSLLPMAGMIIATIGFWQREEQRIRLILLFASPLWLSYNILSGSYAGITAELLAMTSILVALWRYRRSGLGRLTAQKSS